MKLGNISTILKDHPIGASAPCRIDFGGTLDISSFYYPLRHLTPTTVNLALDRRTAVTLRPNGDGRIRVASAGIAEAAFAPAAAPYDHPLGLMVAVADYFGMPAVSMLVVWDDLTRNRSFLDSLSDEEMVSLNRANESVFEVALELANQL